MSFPPNVFIAKPLNQEALSEHPIILMTHTAPAKRPTPSLSNTSSPDCQMSTKNREQARKVHTESNTVPLSLSMTACRLNWKPPVNFAGRVCYPVGTAAAALYTLPSPRVDVSSQRDRPQSRSVVRGRGRAVHRRTRAVRPGGRGSRVVLDRNRRLHRSWAAPAIATPGSRRSQYSGSQSDQRRVAEPNCT